MVAVKSLQLEPLRTSVSSSVPTLANILPGCSASAPHEGDAENFPPQARMEPRFRGAQTRE